MKKYILIIRNSIFISLFIFNYNCKSTSKGTVSSNDFIPRLDSVPHPEVRKNQGLEIDTRLLDSYGLLPKNIREYYFSARQVFSENLDADFTNEKIIKAAQKYKVPLMGGPMLGNLEEDKVTVWLRPSTRNSLVIKVAKTDGSDKKTYTRNSIEPGVEQRIVLDGLSSNTEYKYTIFAKKRKIAEGGFTTAPASNEKGIFKLVFGSCFHKIGIHNPNLMNQILKNKPLAMMLLGDIASEDNDNRINMHLADYQLRDVSDAWRNLAANLPLYASWDDHDYFNNDLSGIPEGFSEMDREALRALWYQNWNNPKYEKPGINFNAVLGPVEIIMLDTRSLRENKRRGQYGSFLGIKQLNWLKETLKKSKAPFKVISCGTMWSDYITPGKDSWGTWDTEAREELFSFIEDETISGVLLISGDRHGARAFTIPRPSGFEFHEFEVASLGGVPGPDAMAEDTSNQLFGYYGTDIRAFGEFIFDTTKEKPSVVFRLIDERGNILEEHGMDYNILTPH